jgi:hypothetical protein
MRVGRRRYRPSNSLHTSARAATLYFRPEAVKEAGRIVPSFPFRRVMRVDAVRNCTRHLPLSNISLWRTTCPQRHARPPLYYSSCFFTPYCPKCTLCFFFTPVRVIPNPPLAALPRVDPMHLIGLMAWDCYSFGRFRLIAPPLLNDSECVMIPLRH